jgi:dTDP-4-dehydrorhamnose reductase
MNILVTGANGQLGNELRLLAPQHPQHRFFFTDVAELDITRADAVDAFVGQHSIQAVLNCAAFTAVDKAESNEDAALLINATAVQHLADACRRYDATLLHVSTDYVFDGHSCLPYREDHPTAPLSAYGRTKLAGEKAALSAPRTAIVRTAWLYSAFGNNFVKTMQRLGREKTSLGVVFDQIGTPTYAADLAKCLLTMVQRLQDKAFVPGVFHFSTEGVCSWYDFAREIMRQSGLTCAVQPIETKDYPTPAARPPFSVLNKATVKATYDLVIPHWQDSLTVCLHELAKNN